MEGMDIFHSRVDHDWIGPTSPSSFAKVSEDKRLRRATTLLRFRFSLDKSARYEKGLALRSPPMPSSFAKASDDKRLWRAKEGGRGNWHSFERELHDYLEAFAQPLRYLVRAKRLMRRPTKVLAKPAAGGRTCVRTSDAVQSTGRAEKRWLHPCARK